jgi:hypothetical protein
MVIATRDVEEGALDRTNAILILLDRHPTLSVVQYRGSAELAMLEISQRAWRLTHRIGHGCGAYPEPLR